MIAHRVHHHLAAQKDLFKAVRATVAELEGAYALAVVSEAEPERIILAREGCPVVVGLGVDENFVASDVSALLPVTRRFMFLEEGDVADIRRTSIKVLDKNGDTVERPVRESELSADAAEKGQYRHFMLKEIHEQPRAVADTLAERVANGRLLEAAFGPAATEVFKRTEHVHIIACGTSYHSGVGRALFHRADLPAAVHGRDRERIPLPQSRWCRRIRCSSRSRSPAKPPTRSPRCASRSRPAICRRSRSATCPKARWCASPSW